LSILFDRERYIDYLAADLDSRKAMTVMDITDIQHPDGSFDVILCSHVLEHIPDDRKALSEFFRVLRPGGWAILQVPIAADTTFEDPTITDPAERQKLFGQHDHVRNYGPDYSSRLAEAGFSVSVDGFVRELDEAETERLGLMRHEDVYFCRKEMRA
jgi:ubiquinone/menaquinone biosynthesis C-methylase UbiE